MNVRSLAFATCVGLSCTVAVAQTAPSPSPSPGSPASASPAAASPSATPFVRRYFNGRPIQTPTPTPNPSASATPYVKRYFNGRAIETPTPTPNPSATATPYVKRYFNGRAIETPTPTPDPFATATPYVKRYFRGHLLATPPPTPVGPVLAPTPKPNATSASSATPYVGPTPYVKRYFNGRPIEAPLPGAPSTPEQLRPRPSAAPYRIEELLGGVWHCTTFGGSTLAHEFSRGDDGSSFVVDTRVALPGGKTATLQERYRHHPQSGTWTVALVNGTFVANAPEWSGDTWTFVGKAVEDGRSSRVAMVYRRLSHDVFRRDFQRAAGAGAAFATYSGETCTR